MDPTSLGLHHESLLECPRAVLFGNSQLLLFNTEIFAESIQQSRLPCLPYELESLILRVCIQISKFHKAHMVSHVGPKEMPDGTEQGYGCSLAVP